MTRLIRLPLTLPLLVLLAGHASAGAAGSCGAEEAALRTIKLEEWPGYYRTQDGAGLAAFLHEDFRVVGADGSVGPRSEEIAWVATNAWSPTGFRYTISSITCPREGVAITVGSTANRWEWKRTDASRSLTDTCTCWRFIALTPEGV